MMEAVQRNEEESFLLLTLDGELSMKLGQDCGVGVGFQVSYDSSRFLAPSALLQAIWIQVC